MKVKVIKRYIDAETNQLMEEGSVAEYTQERARGLIKKGYVEEEKTEPKEEKKTAKEAPAKKTTTKKTSKKK